MSKRAYVTANKGFVSEEMEWIRALCYAFQLKQLGNVNVKVNKI
ncbi:hypothetical protein [Paenibacillus sinopodophylli]|nr:hypothetical protein [Paenibacillus sinopodophylli]